MTTSGLPELVDAQVHVWDRDHPGRPWDPARSAARAKLIGAAHAGGDDHAPVTHDDMAAAMTSVGVGAAVLVATSHYGWDNSYSFEAVDAHPGRFAVVGRLDPAAPDVAEQAQALARRPGAVGVRILVMNDEHHAQVESGFFAPLLRAAEQAGLALSVFPPGHLADVGTIARAHPELRILVDHLGVAQPPLLQPDDPPLRRLPELLGLAAYPNVAVKITAAPTLSEKPFPYMDLWPALHEVLSRFGPDRCAWGTDWQRVRELLSYEQGVHWITDTDELSAADKGLVLGRSIRGLLRWRRPPERRHDGRGRPGRGDAGPP